MEIEGYTSQEAVLLVKAAPELLDACYSILGACEDMELDDIGALDDVRYAIALAEGKSVEAWKKEREG